jgi:hypothetical protein
LFRSKRGKLLVAFVVALVAASSAVAYWTAAGGGEAQATVTSPDPVTLSAGTPTAFLYPGTSADVAVNITNPNPFQVRVPSLVLDIGEGDNGFAVDSGHSGCTLSALSYVPQTNGGNGWDVAASSTRVLDLANAVSLATSAANECQGATFTVYLKVGT